jgi:hypothetical protein
MSAAIVIPENVLAVASAAHYGALWRTVGRSDSARARACARSNVVLQAALAEWGATVDDNDGHNEQYRIVTAWTPKDQG